MKKDIIVKMHFTCGVDAVWQMLSEIEHIKKWSPAIEKFEPVVGFEFEQQQKGRGDWDGMIYHKVTEVIPKKKLSYSFMNKSKNGKTTLNTLVSFTILPEEGGTLLKLEHTGFEGMKNIMTSHILEAGWKGPIAKRFHKELDEKE